MRASAASRRVSPEHGTTKQASGQNVLSERIDLSMPRRERTDLNMTRRLTRMIRLSGMPLAGPAHQLRKRFVQATHALCVLQRSCTHGRIVMAMRDLLEGWADTEEEHYQHRLLNAAESGASAPTVHTQAMVRGCTTKCGGGVYSVWDCLQSE